MCHLLVTTLSKFFSVVSLSPAVIRFFFVYSLAYGSWAENGKLVDIFATLLRKTDNSDGFFLACEDLGECTTIRSPSALFVVVVIFQMDISSHTLIPLFRPGSVHSGSAS